MLAATVILMGVSTLMIGVLPTYALIGAFASVLLVIARLLQGFSAGGEWSGSAAFVVEYAPPTAVDSTAVGSSSASSPACSPMGSLLGTVLPEDAMNAWGWRVPFILGILVGVIGLYVRLRLEDTPAFRVIEQREEVADAPVKESFTAHGGESLTAFGFTIAWTVSYYILLTYMPTYVSETLGLSLTAALTANSIGLVVLMAIIPFTGALSERIGRKPLLLAFSVFTVLLSYPLFLLVSTGAFPS
jgi:MHS family proline/betaine transporter-like MFS transporter